MSVDASRCCDLLVGLEGMPNPSNFKEKDMDAEQDRILDTLSPEEATAAWGEFDKMMLDNAAERAIWFTGYTRTYLERDLQEISSVTALPDLRRLMRAAALRR